MEGRDLVRDVTCDGAVRLGARRRVGRRDRRRVPARRRSGVATAALRVAAYDLGMKWNILRRFTAHGCDVRVFPATTPAERPAGDEARTASSSATGPAIPRCSTTSSTTRATLVAPDVPIFGICLGHQVLALAMGGRTYKLKFGHRGTNHPVKDLATGQIEITSQNHGFAVDPASRCRPTSR